MWSEEAEAPTAPRVVPKETVLLCLAALLCLSLRASGTELLVAATERGGGGVAACHYLTGTRLVERQSAVVAGGSAWRSCALLRAGE